jgi:hypothetical protein
MYLEVKFSKHFLKRYYSNKSPCICIDGLPHQCWYRLCDVHFFLGILNKMTVVACGHCAQMSQFHKHSRLLLFPRKFRRWLKKFKVIILTDVKDSLHQFHMKSFKRPNHTYIVTLHTQNLSTLTHSKIDYKCHTMSHPNKHSRKIEFFWIQF